jgi:Tfp pilus assembly PilM family ATPase
MQDTLVRTVELPNSADTEFRTLLKLNTSKYFKHEPKELVLDCVPVAVLTGRASLPKEVPVLATGVREEFFRMLMAAAQDAHLNVTRVTSTQVGLTNGLRLSRRDSFENEVIAIVEFGPRTCAVTALVKGQPALSRVVELDEVLNSGLEEAFATPYPVAAEIRTNLIRNRLQKLLFPIGRDISAAVDFFEAQLNCRIDMVAFPGGSERADLIAETLQAQLDVPYKQIDPAPAVKLALPSAKSDRAARDLPRLAGAIGAAAAAYIPQLVQINLLADRIESRTRARKDPVRNTLYAAAAAIVLMLGWAGYIHYALSQTNAQLARLDREMTEINSPATQSARIALEGQKIITTLGAIEQHATNRFLFASAFNALQEVVSQDVQVVRLTLQQSAQYIPGVRGSRSAPAKKACSAEKVVLTVQAKNFADPKSSDIFMDRVANHPYFQANLRKVDPVVLKSRTPRQVDPLNPNQVYTLFTIECLYPERVLAYE